MHIRLQKYFYPTVKYDDERIRFRKQNKKSVLSLTFCASSFLPFCPEEDRKEKKRSRNFVNLESNSEKFKHNPIFSATTDESRSDYF